MKSVKAFLQAWKKSLETSLAIKLDHTFYDWDEIVITDLRQN